MRSDRRIKGLLETYGTVRDAIRERLREFDEVKRCGPLRVYEELVFCLLTPQSRSKAADKAVKRLKEAGVLLKGDRREVALVLRECGVRFHNVKARYVVLSRELLNDIEAFNRLLEGDPREVRERLVERVKGFGYKEASHFLRNVGIVDLAILDRHVLRCLKSTGVIRSVPRTLTRKRYLTIESKFLDLSRELGLKPAELDLLLWYIRTGEVFK
ncbi:MAG: N-glycosylase/DNA lyase [Aigarchaeota archaeon]|nr:N-glycosylase/DNA lyase [Aigarchaeota archaeon]MDW8093168.1 N-glycosylase/DNA lyase [Nitrososphaerota archaeon]